MTTKERQQTSWSEKCKARYPQIGAYDDATMGGFWYPERGRLLTDRYAPNYRRPPR